MERVRKSIDQSAPARLSARIRSAANTKLPFSTETTSVSAGSLAESSPAITSTRAAISEAEKRTVTVGRPGMERSLIAVRTTPLWPEKIAQGVDMKGLAPFGRQGGQDLVAEGVGRDAEHDDRGRGSR